MREYLREKECMARSLYLFRETVKPNEDNDISQNWGHEFKHASPED